MGQRHTVTRGEHAGQRGAHPFVDHDGAVRQPLRLREQAGRRSDAHGQHDQVHVEFRAVDDRDRTVEDRVQPAAESQFGVPPDLVLDHRGDRLVHSGQHARQRFDDPHPHTGRDKGLGGLQSDVARADDHRRAHRARVEQRP